MDPNERHESCAEILDMQDIADAVVSVRWTLARSFHVQFMEPMGHMHHDADGDALNERVEAADHGFPIRVHSFRCCLHVQAVCNGRPLRLGCHGEILQMRLDDR